MTNTGRYCKRHIFRFADFNYSEMFYIETIRLFYGCCSDLRYHRNRVLSSVDNTSVWTEIEHAVKLIVERYKNNALVKCSITYDNAGISDVICTDYNRRCIKALVPVEAHYIDYSLKYADRTELDALKRNLRPYEEPVIVKDGLITDTTFSNVVFEDENGRLFTPKVPLLCGTMRERLLDLGLVNLLDISVEELQRYRKVHLVNAMNGLGEFVIGNLNF